jgi:hypothetical protein
VRFPGRRDTEGMSQFSPGGTSPGRTPSRLAIPALFTYPVYGCALSAAGAVGVAIVASFAATLALGDSAQPGQPAYDYAQTHGPDSPLFFLTGYPLVLAACCILVLAATALAAFRRRVPAVLPLLTAAALPWIPGIAFIIHLFSLPLY